MYRFIFSLLFIFSLFNLLSSLENIDPPSKIIYLKGTCSSGKSTLIKSIRSTFPDLVIIDEDIYHFTAYLEGIKSRFPVEYEIINQAVETYNIYSTLRANNRCFKIETTDEMRKSAEHAISIILEELEKPESLSWKKEISQKITKHCLDDIQKALQNNKDILVDAWYIKPDLLQTLYPENPIVKVMLYCPLEVAYERLLKRNEESASQGNLTEKRLTAQLVGSFCTLYEVTNHPLQFIEEVTFSAYNDTFQLIANNLSDNESPRGIFCFRDLSKNELFKLQSKFLEPFQNGSQCYPYYISPKEKYDVIIDNTNLKTDEAIHYFEEILQYERT